MTKKWYQQKTTWTGITALVAAAAGYFTGAMSPVEAIQTALIGIGSIFMRQGIESIKK